MRPKDCDLDAYYLVIDLEVVGRVALCPTGLKVFHSWIHGESQVNRRSRAIWTISRARPEPSLSIRSDALTLYQF